MRTDPKHCVNFTAAQYHLRVSARSRVSASIIAALIAVAAPGAQGTPPAAQVVDVSAYYKENLRFHWLMVEATGNAPLIEAYRNLTQKLHLSRLTNLSHGMGMQASVADHREIATALRAGNARHCELLLADHVQRAHQRLVTHTDPQHPQPGDLK